MKAKYEFWSDQAREFPQMVVVAINNSCDFSCTHCFHPTYRSKPDFCKKEMDFSTFAEIVDQMVGQDHSLLRLIGWGEPLLHPQIAEFCDYATLKLPPRNVTLITNGYHLEEDLAGKLLKTKLGFVEISIDAACQQSYVGIRRSRYADSYERVVKNVEALVNLKRSLNSPTRIGVSYIVHPNNASQREFLDFRDKWQHVADEVLVRPVHSFKNTVKVISQKPFDRVPCRNFWARFNITPYGEATVCYNDWERAYLLGKVDQCNTIAKIWQGETLKKIRQDQIEGKFHEPCLSCKDYNCGAWLLPYELLLNRS